MKLPVIAALFAAANAARLSQLTSCGDTILATATEVDGELVYPNCPAIRGVVGNGFPKGNGFYQWFIVFVDKETCVSKIGVNEANTAYLLKDAAVGATDRQFIGTYLNHVQTVPGPKWDVLSNNGCDMDLTDPAPPAQVQFPTTVQNYIAFIRPSKDSLLTGGSCIKDGTANGEVLCELNAGDIINTIDRKSRPKACDASQQLLTFDCNVFLTAEEAADRQAFLLTQNVVAECDVETSVCDFDCSGTQTNNECVLDAVVNVWDPCFAGQLYDGDGKLEIRFYPCTA